MFHDLDHTIYIERVYCLTCIEILRYSLNSSYTQKCLFVHHFLCSKEVFNGHDNVPYKKRSISLLFS